VGGRAPDLLDLEQRQRGLDRQLAPPLVRVPSPLMSNWSLAATALQGV